jgi:hypothetical protein
LVVRVSGGAASATAAWHAVQNDRTQRNMLEAAAKQKFGAESKFFKDLKWTLDQLNPLENDRNNVLHAPYSLTIEDGMLKYIPVHFGGNRRANELKNKDLAIELQSIEKRLDLLVTFIDHLGAHRNAPDDTPTWPERPHLPKPAHKTTHKALISKKSLPRQPPSS